MNWRSRLRFDNSSREYELTPQEVGALQSAGEDRKAFLQLNGLWPKEETGTERVNGALTKIVRGKALTWQEIFILQSAARDRETYRRRNHTWEEAWEITELIESALKKLREDFYLRGE